MSSPPSVSLFLSFLLPLPVHTALTLSRWQPSLILPYLLITSFLLCLPVTVRVTFKNTELTFLAADFLQPRISPRRKPQLLCSAWRSRTGGLQSSLPKRLSLHVFVLVPQALPLHWKLLCSFSKTKLPPGLTSPCPVYISRSISSVRQPWLKDKHQGSASDHLEFKGKDHSFLIIRPSA